MPNPRRTGTPLGRPDRRSSPPSWRAHRWGRRFLRKTRPRSPGCSRHSRCPSSRRPSFLPVSRPHRPSTIRRSRDPPCRSNPYRRATPRTRRRCRSTALCPVGNSAECTRTPSPRSRGRHHTFDWDSTRTQDHLEGNPCRCPYSRSRSLLSWRTPSPTNPARRNNPRRSTESRRNGGPLPTTERGGARTESLNRSRFARGDDDRASRARQAIPRRGRPAERVCVHTKFH